MSADGDRVIEPYVSWDVAMGKGIVQMIAKARQDGHPHEWIKRHWMQGYMNLNTPRGNNRVSLDRLQTELEQEKHRVKTRVSEMERRIKEERDKLKEEKEKSAMLEAELESLKGRVSSGPSNLADVRRLREENEDLAKKLEEKTEENSRNFMHRLNLGANVSNLRQDLKKEQEANATVNRELQKVQAELQETQAELQNALAAKEAITRDRDSYRTLLSRTTRKMEPFLDTMLTLMSTNNEALDRSTSTSRSGRSSRHHGAAGAAAAAGAAEEDEA